VTLGLPSWPATLQALALVVSSKAKVTTQGTLFCTFPFRCKCFLLCRFEFFVSYIAHVHSSIFVQKNLQKIIVTKHAHIINK
jgi:hypothetical protein